VLLLERFPLDGETTTFLATLGDDPSLTLIVLPAASDADSTKARLPGRAHVLSGPLDKTHLFNALHASHQRAVSATVVSLAERMERRSLLARVAGLRVLVAEDHPTNRLVIGHILEQAGVRCRLVEDGQQALDALEAEHFDLAILDMHLPNLGGIEAFQLYRFAHAGASPQLPFILLTANALAEARAQAQAAGIDYFMTKPFLSADLLRTIAEATGGATAPAGAPPAPAVPKGQIDPAPLADLFAVASSRDFGKQLVAGFEADGRGLLEQMTAALDAGDGSALRERAHALQGSAAALGLVALRDQARRLHAANEETLRTEGHGLVAEIAEAFDPALLRLREEVAVHLGR
jgi:two-component system sensor histidine kinase RpfC